MVSRSVGGRIWRALAAVALVAVLVGCSTQSEPGAADAEPPIRLGFSAWPGWFPWQVARDAGLFEKNGLKVDLVWYDDYTKSIDDLTGNRIDANSETLNDALASYAAGGQPVIVLVNDNSTGNDQVIVNPAIRSIRDLKGKRIGVEVGVVDHYLLLLGLQSVGLSPKDVTIVPLVTEQAARQFAAGKLDACAVFAPFTDLAKSTGRGKVLFSSRDFPGAIPDHLVVTRALVDRRPGDVQKLVNTWYDTLDYIARNPEKSREIMARRAGVSLAEYARYRAGTRMFSLEENLEAFTPGADMAHLNYAAGSIAAFLQQTTMVKDKPAFQIGLVDDRFVRAYARGRATPQQEAQP